MSGIRRTFRRGASNRPMSKMKEQQSPTAKIARLNRLAELVCGIYSRIARRLHVHRTYVSRVARGERRSPEIENALMAEYERVQRSGTGLLEE